MLAFRKLVDIFFFSKKTYFVDLFVRVSNSTAIQMYKKLGYSVYRRVLDYYSGEKDEDAFGSRWIS